MYTVKTICHFSAAHRLTKPYVGKCNQLHGHTFKVEVVMEASELDKNGMVVDFKRIKEVVSRLDHQYLNDFMDQPTAENLAKMLFEQITNVSLEPIFVRVWESETSYAEYFESE